MTDRLDEVSLIRQDNLWSEYTDFPRCDWQYDVANGDTNLGYWDWVEHQLEFMEDEEDG